MRELWLPADPVAAGSDVRQHKLATWGTRAAADNRACRASGYGYGGIVGDGQRDQALSGPRD